MKIRDFRQAVSVALSVGLLLGAAAAQAPAQAPPGDDPAWKWPESRWRAIVGKVRAGRSLLPAAWPDGAKVAVALSFDFDNETPALRDNQTSPGVLSQGEYGARAALPRVLALLERQHVPATFFVPAVSAELHRESMQKIVAGGHEVGLHGWIHERNSLLGEADERELMARSLSALQAITGRRPVGLRTPSWDFSPHTARLVKELGLLYDSSLMADDSPYELLLEGERSGLVELPVEWILDDYPYFGMDRFGATRPHSPPSHVLEIWQAEFDRAREEGGLFVLTMHPHVIGHRSRIAMLERLVEHMRSRPGVWFATHEQVARHVVQGGSAPSSPGASAEP
jgi:peptidoglycan/xylan/chitin deacetylase (PgdA/CDA1 family)